MWGESLTFVNVDLCQYTAMTVPQSIGLSFLENDGDAFSDPTKTFYSTVMKKGKHKSLQYDGSWCLM